MSDTFRRIREAMDSMRIFDVHSHLGGGGYRQARTLADIISYHWLATELIRAAGRRPASDPQQDPEGYIREVLPYFPMISNTSNHYALMGILKDLYGLKDRTITEANWRELDSQVRRTAEDPSWLGEVLAKAKVEKVLVAIRDLAQPDERFVPYEYAEYLYMPLPQRPSRGTTKKRKGLIEDGRPFPAVSEELDELICARLDALAAERKVRALHVWLGWNWHYSPPDMKRLAELLGRLSSASKQSQEALFLEAESLRPDERDMLVSFCADSVAKAAARHRMVVQFFHGMTPYEPGSLGCVSTWDPDFLRSLKAHLAGHRDVLFDLFLGTRIPGHEAASVSRVYCNLMVSGAWWHAFAPSTMTSFFRDRLEMLPSNAWNAFYSDGYIVEWIYGKLLVTKHCLARALAGMVEEGFLTEGDALSIAQRLLYENAAAAYCAGA